MRIILNGAGGRMGHEVTRLVSSEDSVVKIDRYNGDLDFYTSLTEYGGDGDVIIDFSNPASTFELTEYAVARGIPLVIATTGHSDSDREMIIEASRSVPVFYSANMSLGVAMLVKLAKQAATAFPEADIEIVEAHHNRKLDAPSGTAIMIADGIKQAIGERRIVCGREGRMPRTHGEIGIHSIRGGNIVGTHEVMLISDTQTLTLKHEAHDRALFAEGAIAAARFIVSRNAGIYDMYDMIEAMNEK